MLDMQATTRILGTPRTLDSPHTWTKRFFTGVGAVCIVLATIGFGPGVYRGVRGDISIPLVAHVHAAIMMAWLAAYLLQAILAARGDMVRHRRIGRAAAVLAGAAWISMAVATVTALQRYDPDTFGFLVNHCSSSSDCWPSFPSSSSGVWLCGGAQNGTSG